MPRVGVEFIADEWLPRAAWSLVEINARANGAWQNGPMNEFALDEASATPAMCKAWRLFREHGNLAGDMVENEIMRCLRAGNPAGAAEWREIADALGEWLR